MKGGVLQKDRREVECSDYTLHGRSCWITVSNLSVYIARMPYGVRAEIYPRGKENEDPIDTAEAGFRKQHNQVLLSEPETDLFSACGFEE